MVKVGIVFKGNSLMTPRKFFPVLLRLRKNLIVACWIAASTVFPSAVRTQAPFSESVAAAEYLEDFDAAWTFIRDSYAYFDRKQTDWERVRTFYRPRVAEVRSKREFVGVLERVLEELYDPHVHLGVNTPSSPRLVPSGTDLLAEWRGNRAMILPCDRAPKRSGQGSAPEWRSFRWVSCPSGQRCRNGCLQRWVRLIPPRTTGHSGRRSQAGTMPR